jgi:hypothetical protein
LDDGARGAVWVFVREGTRWAQEGPKLVGRGEVGHGQFGYSVALSGDGDTALIGAPEDRQLRIKTGGCCSGYGAAWVFTRSGGKWWQEGAKLSGRGEPPYGDFGLTATLSGKGTTALVGSYFAYAGRQTAKRESSAATTKTTAKERLGSSTSHNGPSVPETKTPSTSV